MKRKILVPMFASVVALSMNSVANADEIENKNIENKEENKNTILDLGEYEDATYKIAAIKDGVAVKIREQGSVQHIAYTGDEFKILGTQGEWVRIVVEDDEGWIPARFVDIKEAYGYTTENKVNFRKEANVDCEILEELEIGSTVKVLENNGSWIKVKKGENEGYISALYVSDEAPVIEVEENVRNTENDRNSNNNNGTSNDRSNSNNNSGQAEKPSQKPSQKPPQNNNGSYNPPASNTSAAQAVVNLAYAKIGSPYVWGAEGPNSFDCSGLTSYVYRNAAGITIPRSSSAQAGYGKTVSKSNLQPGDLVFFSTNGTGRVSHVGIYIGGGKMIHSPKPGKSVSVVSINSSYYASAFITAKRVL